MTYFYMERNREIIEIDRCIDKCWVSLIEPTGEELSEIAAHFDIPPETMRAALDLDERSRIETDENYRMILINIPTREETNDRELYTTVPMAILLTENNVITVCSKDTHILRGFASGKVRDFHPGKQSRFVLQLLYATAARYLLYLRSVEKKTDAMENDFSRYQRNRELLELTKLQKSLVYFTTGLRSNESVIEKLIRTGHIQKYEEDADLLEDVIVESKQAIEMAKIYSEILQSLSDTFSSVISNNLNVAMKVLAMITLVMSIPTMIFSAYGMNLNLASMPFATHPFGFPIVIGIAAASALAAIFVILRIKLFK